MIAPFVGVLRCGDLILPQERHYGNYFFAIASSFYNLPLKIVSNINYIQNIIYKKATLDKVNQYFHNSPPTATENKKNPIRGEVRMGGDTLILLGDDRKRGRRYYFMQLLDLARTQ